MQGRDASAAHLVTRAARPGRLAGRRVRTLAAPAFALLALLAIEVERAFAAVTIELVVDGSGSMWGQLGGLPKTLVVREGLKPVLDRMARLDVRVGLTVFGTLATTGCDNIDSPIQPSPVDSVDVPGTIGAMSPRGLAPVVDAVKRAGAELEGIDGKRLVVAIVDGADGCLPNPCQALREWHGKDGTTVHVLGLAISDTDVDQQLGCLAEAGGGVYTNVSTIRGIEETVRSWLDKAVATDREERAAAERARIEADRIRQATHVKIQLRTDLPPSYCREVEISRLELDGKKLEPKAGPLESTRFPCRGETMLFDSVSDPGNHVLTFAYRKRSASGDVAESEVEEVSVPVAPSQTATVQLEARAGWTRYRVDSKVISGGAPAVAPAAGNAVPATGKPAAPTTSKPAAPGGTR